MPRPKTKGTAKGVPLSYQGPSDLRSRFSMTASKDGMSVRIRGRELVGQLHTLANVAYGDNLLEMPLSPAILPGRLSRFAEIYERFKFHAMRVEYTPTVAATQSGSIVLAYDVDIDDATPTGSTSIARLLSNQSAAMYRVNAPFSYPLKMDLTMPYMYTAHVASAAEARTEYQGQLLVNWAGDANASPVNYGHLFIDYDVELRNPQIEDMGLSCTFPTVTVPSPEIESSPSRGAPPGLASGTRLYAKLADGLVRLGQSYLSTWLDNNLAQDGASFKRAFETLPTWSEKFIKLGIGETLKGIIMGNATATPWYVPRGTSTVKGVTTTTPAKLTPCEFAASVNLYGSSMYDSQFLGPTGTSTGITDFTMLQYIANNGPKFIISGDAAFTYDTRWADYMCVSSVGVASGGVRPDLIEQNGGDPVTIGTYVRGNLDATPPFGDAWPFFISVGNEVDVDTVSTATAAHWINIINDTDHPVYITAYRMASGAETSLAGYTGGLVSDESSPPASNSVPLLIELDEVPSFIAPVYMSRTPAALAEWQTIHVRDKRVGADQEAAEDSAAAPNIGAGGVGLVLPTLPVRR